MGLCSQSRCPVAQALGRQVLSGPGTRVVAGPLTMGTQEDKLAGTVVSRGLRPGLLPPLGWRVGPQAEAATMLVHHRARQSSARSARTSSLAIFGPCLIQTIPLTSWTLPCRPLAQSPGRHRGPMQDLPPVRCLLSGALPPSQAGEPRLAQWQWAAVELGQTPPSSLSCLPVRPFHQGGQQATG